MSEKPLHIHLDLVGGLAGDMFCAGAIDAGLIELETLQNVLRDVGLGPVEVVADRVVRGAIEGTNLSFRGWDRDQEASHRHLSEIRRMLADSELPVAVTRRATEMFDRLGKAEATVHGVELDDVHFHEVGAIDSILDFVAAAWIIETVDATWSTGPVPAGRGTIETDHGTIPVPAPATTHVLQGFDIEYRDVEAELVTPTGATIAATISEDTDSKRGTVVASGFGCGSRQLSEFSNVVRFTVLQRTGAETGNDNTFPADLGRESIVELTCEVDDASPEIIAYAEEKLREAGALDVITEPVHMKKGRLGQRLSVLCTQEEEPTLVRTIFSETTTLGIRRLPVERWVLRRAFEQVDTSFGKVRIKLGYLDGKLTNVAPEYESCARRARECDVSIRRVFEEALAAGHRDVDVED